jgi:hypothetical protein
MRKQLLPGEQVIVVTRQQGRRLFLPAAAFILTPALAAYACAWIVKGGPGKLVPAMTGTEWTPWLLLLCLVFAVTVLFGYCVPKFLQWLAVRYILTSRRIIARFGMLRRRDWQLSLAAVRNVGLRQTLIQRTLRSGNISLDTGQPGGTLMPDVPEAARFRNFILEAIDGLPAVSAKDNENTWARREGGQDEW